MPIQFQEPEPEQEQEVFLPETPNVENPIQLDNNHENSITTKDQVLKVSLIIQTVATVLLTLCSVSASILWILVILYSGSIQLIIIISHYLSYTISGLSFLAWLISAITNIVVLSRDTDFSKLKGVLYAYTIISVIAIIVVVIKTIAFLICLEVINSLQYYVYM